MKESPLKSLNKYLLKYKWRLFAGIVFIILSNWFNLYPAKIFRNAIDVVTDTLRVYPLFEDSSLQQHYYEQLVSGFVLFGVALIAFAVTKGLFTFFMRYTIIMMSRHIEYDLKNEIYNHYQELDISFYKENKTGDIMNRIGDDVTKVRMYLGPSIMYLANLIVLFVLVIGTMIDINSELTLYVLLPLPVMSIIIYFVSKHINLKSERVQSQLSNIFSLTQESFSGIRVIKSYNKVEDTISNFDQESENYRQKAMDLVKTESLFHPVIIFLPVLSTLITIYAGGIKVVEGEITYGNIAEFVIYINLLTWPVASLGWVTSLIQRASASMQRINEFLHTEPKIKNPSTEPLDVKGEIEFRNISFTYPENDIEALKNINFKIPEGGTLAIIGKTGSGKSTIVNLMNRLYDTTKGEILIDGKNIKEVNLFDLRRQIGAVPQDVFLFSETIKNNICFGVHDGDMNDEELTNAAMQAAKDAVVHENILQFEKGYDTKVGERGVTLSGGQKQRISIARALVKAPKILIFDDCLSAVDTETEEAILTNLKRIMANKTTILVSHRVSTIKHADHIIVLDNGEIVEEGNHEQLLKLKGVYQYLHQKQRLESEIN
jgi:ATP-binding cassette subfamily B protein